MLVLHRKMKFCSLLAGRVNSELFQCVCTAHEIKLFKMLFCLLSSKLTSYLVTKVSFKISNYDYLGVKMRIYIEKESCEYKFSDQTTNKLRV